MHSSIAPHASKIREIRVFLSSTFRDMNHEREFLVERVFPELRRICAERMVGFTEIDLRWGVTEEASKNGHTVHICLEEIDRCRDFPPFFIGFLGDRYGWIPKCRELAAYWIKHNDTPFAQRIEQALEEGISVTELEMRYAFLDEQTQVESNHACVLLRAPELTEQLLKKDQEDPEIKPPLKPEDYIDDPQGKHSALKQRLRERPGLVILDGYDSIEAFANTVKCFLLKQIDLFFPAEAFSADEMRNDYAHRVYAQSRLVGYVDRRDVQQSALAAIQTVFIQDSPYRHVLVQGESGLGKSALLAHLAQQLREQGHWVHEYYVGADGSRSLDDWLNSVLLALNHKRSETAIDHEKRGDESDKTTRGKHVPPVDLITDIEKHTLTFGKLDSKQESKEKNPVNKLWKEITKVLGAVHARDESPVVLILDALDQLSPEEKLDQLERLSLPPQVALLTSATPGVRLAHAQLVPIHPLSEEQRRDALIGYLKGFRKNLSSALIDTIIQSEAAGNPLFLRLLLEELRLHGLHEELGQHIDTLLAHADAATLFEHVLTSMDQDFADTGQKNLAHDAARFLALSWRGLSQSDLALALGKSNIGQRLPDAIVSPLLSRLDAYLLRDSGRNRLMHAALLRPLQEGEHVISMRERLLRDLQENQPSHLIERIHQAGELYRLDVLLGSQGLEDLEKAMQVQTLEPQLFNRVFYQVGAHKQDLSVKLMAVGQAWVNTLNLPEWQQEKRFSEIRSFVTGFPQFSNLGYLLLNKLVQVSKQTLGPKHLDVADSLDALALLYFTQNQYDKAVPLLQLSLEIRKHALGLESLTIADSSDNLAGAHIALGQYDKAQALLEKSLAIRESDSEPQPLAVATSLDNLAWLYQVQADYEKALPRYERALAIRENASEPQPLAVATSLDNLAGLYQAQRHYDKALLRYKRALEIREQVLGLRHFDVASGLKKLADLHFDRLQFEDALPLYKRALPIVEEALSAQHPDVVAICRAIGAIEHAQQSEEDSYNNFIPDEDSYIPEDDHEVDINLGQYEPDRYVPNLEKDEQELAVLKQKYGSQHLDVAASLYKLGKKLYEYGEYDQALPYYDEALEIQKTELNSLHPEIATTLMGLAEVHQAQKNYEKAERDYRQALEIRERIPELQYPEVFTSHNGLAGLYKTQHKCDQAEIHYTRALTIVEQALSPQDPDVVTSLNSLAGLYKMCKTQHKYDQAEILYKRALAIRVKEFGRWHRDIITNLDNLAGIYEVQGKYKQALPLYKHVLAIREQILVSDHGKTSLLVKALAKKRNLDVVTSLNNLVRVYKGIFQYDKALPLCERVLAIHEKYLGSQDLEAATSLYNLAGLYFRLGQYFKALQLLERALAIREQTLDERHAKILQVKKAISVARQKLDLS